jgi:dTDP-glucose pyrophosphorylase
MIDDLTSALLREMDSLEEAALCLSKNSLQIVLIIDNARKLLGTVTDGDIRRALLAGYSMQSPLREIMEKEPTYVRVGHSRRRALQILQDKNLLHLPVLDQGGLVVGLETIQDLLFEEKKNNRVLLMAGGFGKRLYPLTKDTPKPLLPVGGKPILETIVEQLVEEGFHHFLFSVHYRAEQVREHFGDGKRWGIEIQYLEEDKPLGTAGAIGLLDPSQITDPFIVMNADLITKLDFTQLINHHIQSGGAATVCVREYEFTVPFGVVDGENGSMNKIVEKPIHHWFINAGIYVLQPELIGSFETNVALSMPGLLNKISQEGRKVTMFPIHEYWADVGHMEEYERALFEHENPS